MQQATVSYRGVDPAALAAIITALVQHAPAAATTQALELVRAGVDDRDWDRLMAAIAPLPI